MSSKQQSNVSTTIKIVVSTLGTGILAMASSFELLGYYYATAALIISGLCLFFSLYSLAYATTVVDLQVGADFSKLASLFSSKLKHAIDVTLFGSNYGLVVYLVTKFPYMGSKLIEGYIGNSEYTEKIRLAILSLLLLGTFCFFVKEDLSCLNFLPKISFMSVIYYLGLSTFYAFKYGKSISELKKGKTDNLVNGFINFVFALHCQFSFLDIYTCMRDKTIGNVVGVIGTASVLLTIIYGLSGFMGYKAVGSAIGKSLTLDIFVDKKSELMQKIYTESWDKHGILPSISIIGFLIAWFGTIIFASYQVIAILQSWLSFGKKKLPRQYAAVVYSLSLLCFGLPKEIQFMPLILGLVSAVFTNPLSFLYSSIFLILVTRRFTVKSILAYILIVFSLGITATMIWSAFKEITAEKK